MSGNRETLPRLRKVLCAIITGILVALPGPAWTVVQKIDVLTPRDFGYVIGDLLEHEIRVSLEPPFRIDEQSLPHPERINRWLWLREAQVSAREYSTSTTYRIRLVYQLLSAPEQVHQLFTPEQTLYVSDGKERLPLFIKPWGFSAGPLLKRDPDAIAYTDIQPALPPPPIPTGGYWVGLGLSGAAMLAGSMLLAYIYWAMPLIARSRGPFARAYRRVSWLNKGDEPDRYPAALRAIHHAFNETAGNVVFPETLADFFRAKPQFEHLRNDIEAFFGESRAQFFVPAMRGQRSEFGTLERLCRACRDIERGVA
ncbi:MAG: hypothetical protein OEQ18_03875 [Gammaproteobacteria bacterium]|nr:hypothetical protein [Gammaproteobacteria bacterium]